MEDTRMMKQTHKVLAIVTVVIVVRCGVADLSGQQIGQPLRYPRYPRPTLGIASSSTVDDRVPGSRTPVLPNSEVPTASTPTRLPATSQYAPIDPRHPVETLRLGLQPPQPQEPVLLERAAIDGSGDPTDLASIPADYQPWWQNAALQPMRPSPQLFSVDVRLLIVDALRYSPRVSAISNNAALAQTTVVEACADFDTHAFMESKFVRTSVPTGSVLDAGFDVSRLREEDWFYSGGLRRKNEFGGRAEIAQRFGLYNSNSEFFFPKEQGNARLTLSYEQPLLNGAGRAYNNSLIVLANIDTQIAADRTAAELQEHLLSVTEALWELYTQRVTQLQRQRHLDRAEVILERLEKRRGIDALGSQIARARAAVAIRRAELIRAEAGIRNAEARIRSLVGSPGLLADRTAELVPSQVPMANHVPVNLQDALVTALSNRQEIDAATQEIKAAGVRLNMAQNELLPALDLVLEMYVSGLQGDYSVGRSLGSQFNEGEPSYTAGLIFEVPLHRRAAKSRLHRRELERRQLCCQLQAAVETLHAEVEVAVREVETSYRHLQAKYQSMLGAESDAQYLHRRWESLPGDDRAASFLLEDLLDAQDRLAFEESGFALAQVEYTLSFTRLNRATGTLLRHQQIDWPCTEEEEQPTSTESNAAFSTSSRISRKAEASIQDNRSPEHERMRYPGVRTNP